MSTSVKLWDKLRFFWRAWRYRFKLDPAEISILRRILSPGDVAIDVGTHKGAYSYWMAKAVGPKGHVYGFEPQRHLSEKLRQILLALKIKAIEIHQLGISSKPGQLQLFIPGMGHSSPEATFEKPERYEGGVYEPVAVATLDQVLKSEKRPIRLIKCDVEGHELEVFKGGEEIIRRHKPCLLFECEARHHPDGNIEEVFKYLQDLRYEGFFFLGRRRLPLSEFTKKYQQLGKKPYANNFLFQPKTEG